MTLIKICMTFIPLIWLAFYMSDKGKRRFAELRTLTYVIENVLNVFGYAVLVWLVWT